MMMMTFEHFDGDGGGDTGFDDTVGLSLDHVAEGALSQRFAEAQLLARKLPLGIQRQFVFRHRRQIRAQPGAVLLLDLDDREQLIHQQQS